MAKFANNRHHYRAKNTQPTAPKKLTDGRLTKRRLQKWISPFVENALVKTADNKIRLSSPIVSGAPQKCSLVLAQT